MAESFDQRGNARVIECCGIVIIGGVMDEGRSGGREWEYMTVVYGFVDTLCVLDAARKGLPDGEYHRYRR